jgi:hypothetical protein
MDPWFLRISSRSLAAPWAVFPPAATRSSSSASLSRGRPSYRESFGKKWDIPHGATRRRRTCMQFRLVALFMIAGPHGVKAPTAVGFALQVISVLIFDLSESDELGAIAIVCMVMQITTTKIAISTTATDSSRAGFNVVSGATLIPPASTSPRIADSRMLMSQRNSAMCRPTAQDRRRQRQLIT